MPWKEQPTELLCVALITSVLTVLAGLGGIYTVIVIDHPNADILVVLCAFLTGCGAFIGIIALMFLADKRGGRSVPDGRGG